MAATESKFQDIWELVEGHLDLRSRALNDDDLKELAVILKNDKTVTSIALGENNFSFEGAKTIIEVLNTTTVTELSFHNNQLNSVKIIAEALKNNKTLIKIDFSYNDIDDDGATTIAEMLEVNSTLKIIDLSYTNIGDDGAIAIAKMLETNKSLTGIDLDETNIGPKGKTALTKVLRNDLKIFLNNQCLTPLIGANSNILLANSSEPNVPLSNSHRPNSPSA